MNKNILLMLLVNLFCALSGAPAGVFAYTVPLLVAAVFEKPGEKLIRKISGEADDDFIER